VGRLLAKSAVMVRQLAPFLARRQAPAAAECAAGHLRRLPGVQTPVLPAVLLRVVVAIGRLDRDGRVLGGPLLAVEHPLGRRRRRWRLRRANGPERETQHSRHETGMNPCHFTRTIARRAGASTVTRTTGPDSLWCVTRRSGSSLSRFHSL